MNRQDFIIYFGIVVTILLHGLYVFVQANLSTVGPELADLEKQVKEYKTKNLELKNEILERESLTYLSEEAKRQGFVPAEYIYLK